MKNLERCLVFAVVVLACLSASSASAQDRCREFYERGNRLIEKLSLSFPKDEHRVAGEPFDITVKSASEEDGEGFMLVFVATADTVFLSDGGVADPEIAFAGEWNRYAIDDFRKGPQVVEVIPPKAGPFGLSYALVAARRGCEEKLLSTVGKKVFQIDDNSKVDAQPRCLDGALHDGGLPKLAVKVGSGSPQRVEAGQKVDVAWALEGDFPASCRSNPLYLMFSFSLGARFSGDGFMALPPGAPGPFGIDTDGDRTRVFVPLVAPGSAPESAKSKGGFAFSLQETGELAVGSYLVEVPRLRDRPRFKEDYARHGHPVLPLGDGYRMRASIGAPQLYVQDRYSLARPEKTVRSVDGKYTMQIFDGWYRIIDSDSRNIILERNGYDPRFSPASRFLSAVFEGGYGVEIVDILARKSIYRSSSSTTRTASIDSISWTKGDGFALIEKDGGSEYEEDLTIVPALVDGRIHQYSPSRSSRRPDGPPLSVVIDTDQASIYSLYPSSRSVFDPIALTSASSYLFYEDDESVAPADAARLVRSRRTTSAHCGEWRIVHAAASGPMTVSYGAGDVEGEAPGCPVMATNIDAADRMAASESGVGADRSATGAPIVARAAVSLAIAPANPGAAPGRNRISERISGLVGVAVGSADVGKGILFDEKLLPDGEDTDFEDGLAQWAEMRKWRDVGLGRFLENQERRYDFLHCPEGKDFGINPDQVMYARRWKAGGKSAWIVGSTCFTGSGVGVANGGLYFLTETAGGNFNQYLFGSEFEGHGNGEEFGPLSRYGSPDEYYRNVAASFGYINGYDDMYASLLDDRHIAFVTPSLQFGVFDMRESRVLWISRLNEIGGPVDSISLDASRQNIFVVGQNGVISVFRLAGGKKILNGKYLDDELVLYDPSGYYIATPEAGHFVNLSFDGLPDRYTISQFQTALSRPDHIRSILAGATDSLGPPDITPPPSLWMKVVPTDKPGVVTVEIRSSSTNPLAGVSVTVDGKPVLSRTANGRSIDFSGEVSLDTGARWMSALARDADGLESIPVTVPIAYENPRPSGKLFVLGIGADQYVSPRLPVLKYAASDARTFVEMARKGAGDYYEDVDTTLILDSEALSAQMSQWIAHVSETATARDTVMILAAGHGLRDDDGRFYLADRNTDVANLPETGASWLRIARELAGLPARTFVFLDACHSGSVEFSGANDGAVESMMRQDGRVAVIAASKGRQFSQERSTWGGGVFTTSLARIVGEARDSTDRNRNGVLELSEIYAALKRRVVTLTDGEQTPWIARNEMIGEIPLF